MDEVFKERATEKNSTLLLSEISLIDYFQLSDATAILLIWQTGVRLKALSSLTANHVDFDSGLLNCSGDI
ncbi:hypothetical protein CBF30_04445 [Vagococcus entomophilus]|uniref:Tyr recombinase domain-containing protein n=1 Tax=Vagococcus entomophilus TaxID=1160095 RepID=A0A430AKF7_9ENTE|nr:hypothetical protein CBF30_04445 [Vagococcus entomophilus]